MQTAGHGEEEPTPKEQPESKCNCRNVREKEVKNAVALAFNEVPEMRDEQLRMQERILTDEIGRIDALIRAMTSHQESMENRLEMLVAAHRKTR